MENRERRTVKRIILILMGISILLGGVIYFIYYNNREDDDEIVDISDKEETSDILKKDVKAEDSSEVFMVAVDIKGMVSNPGVYEVENNKRVNDVINLAGGLLEGADTSNINLAKIVKDEMTIIIYSKEEVMEKYKQEVCICDCPYIENDACIAAEEAVEDPLININTAGVDVLIKLPGLGESKARSIIEYRDSNGIFKSIDEIMQVPGIGEAIFEKIKNHITV